VHLPRELRINITRSLFEGNGNGNGNGNGQVHHDKDNKRGPEAAAQFLSLKTFRQSAYSDLEEMYLKNLLASSSGSIKEACMLSKLSRTRLYGLLKKYNIRPEI
jgi:two-component system NtrC family response regulator